MQAKNQIELVQFHPSYSYEDFVQGIKPKPLDGGGISYEIRNGIFKKLCDRKDSTLEFSATVKTYLKITKPFDLTTLGISLNPGINNVSKEEFKKIIEKTNSDGQTTPLFDSLDSFSEYFVIKINSAEHTLDEEGKKFKINTIVPGADVLKSKLKNGPTPFLVMMKMWEELFHVVLLMI